MWFFIECIFFHSSVGLLSKIKKEILFSMVSIPLLRRTVSVWIFFYTISLNKYSKITCEWGRPSLLDCVHVYVAVMWCTIRTKLCSMKRSAKSSLWLYRRHATAVAHSMENRVRTMKSDRVCAPTDECLTLYPGTAPYQNIQQSRSSHNRVAHQIPFGWIGNCRSLHRDSDGRM